MSSPSLSPVETADALLERVATLQQQLDAVHDELAENHRLVTLGTIASIVAHEFNNILTPIISYAQMAKARPDDPALQQKAIDRALDGAQRAAMIAESMLGFAAADTASASPHRTELQACVDEALACLAREPKRDGIRLVLDLPADAAVAMPGVHLLQVLVNLLLNARKAMRQQGGQLTIAAAAATLNAGQPGWALTIRDTGPGIPPAIQDRLFEPFVTQALGSGSAGRRGTGLGLCICRDLVTQAGGTITFTTATTGPERGTMFTVSLPAAA